MNQIIPIKKCNHCRHKLSMGEVAFNEVLCSPCQWKVNNQVRDIMWSVFNDQPYVEPPKHKYNRQ